MRWHFLRHLFNRARTDRISPRLRLEKLEDRSVPATLPSGFGESIVASGLTSATAMELAPNGDLWVLQQGGAVKRFRPGSTTADIVGTVNGLGLSSSGERGLLGIAFDPDFATNKWLYLYYTATTPNIHNRISRFTVNDTDLTDYYLAGTDTTPADAGSTGTPTQSIIFELDALSSATNHNGGAIHFGPDGKLYAAVGDNAAGANAQTLGNLHGKMLRINKDGTIPTDNPFYATATLEERAIWALGLRNPFTFSFQPGTGRMFINDVGQNTFEEINDGIAGSNYGWPSVEGTTGTPPSGPGTYRPPVYFYSHGGGTFQGFAITGGAFYNPVTANFPASYAGDYFFADFVNDWINVRDTSSGTVTSFATGALGVVDLRVASDGALYYLARDEGRAYRVTYTNAAPEITQEPSDLTVPEGGDADFTVQASGAGLGYQWQKFNGTAWTNLSNGGRITGATSTTLTIADVTLAQGDAGQYRVIVSNTAGSDTSRTATLTITTNQPPAATISIDAGLTNGRFIAGQTINFSGTGTDPEDGTLGASRFTWRVDYITSIDSGNPITRPFIAEFSGTTASTMLPATTGPYTLTDVAYRIVLTVTDSAGLSTTVTRDIDPNTATLTVTTSPAGLQVTVDGQPFTSPHTFDSVVGFLRPIGAAATQTLNGTTYDFVSWSDGGAATHTISTPLTATTYTASYTAATLFGAKINFQPASSPGFNGYLADSGLIYGARTGGLTYGWNASNPTTRDRNSSRSPDQRYDTLIHLQKPENRNAVWEIAVPNGTYRVRLVAGDPQHIDSVYRTNVEGVLAMNAKPSSGTRWFDTTVTVTVNDGRLTVSNASQARNNKLAFLEVNQLPNGANGAYTFNAGSGTTVADSSGRGINGTRNTGTTWAAGQGGIGSSLTFNGTSGFVALNQNVAPVLGGSATVAFWIRTTQTGHSTMWQAPGVLGVESAGNGNDVFWGWLDATGRIGIQAGNVAGAKSTSPINNGQWHHVALTRNATTGVVQVYVNGVLNASATSETGAKTTGFASIGRIEDTAGTPAYFAGTLDEMRFYDRVLTASEVAALAR